MLGGYDVRKMKPHESLHLSNFNRFVLRADTARFVDEVLPEILLPPFAPLKRAISLVFSGLPPGSDGARFEMEARVGIEPAYAALQAAA